MHKNFVFIENTHSLAFDLALATLFLKFKTYEYKIICRSLNVFRGK